MSLVTVSLLDSIVERAPLAADGKSGSVLERARLADGTRLVLKRVIPLGDWIMRATADSGRAQSLYSQGILQRTPPVIDHAIVGVEEDGQGWILVMRDVSDTLLADDAMISRRDSRRILEAVTALHNTFWNQSYEELCSLPDRYSVLSPATAQRESERADLVPKLLARGWEIFADLAPPDVVEAISAIHDQPERFAEELRAPANTLIHGDLKLANIGLARDRVVILDWGSLTGMAPPAVDFAWYLAINASRISATKDEIGDDFRELSGPHHDETALQLALMGALAQLGWDKAIGAVEHPDEDARAWEKKDLQWWYAATRKALENWPAI
jgi:thiamine kinase-like enzyme